jgi:hypothetical protein
MKYNLVTFKKLKLTDGSFKYEVVYEKGIEVPSKILLDPMMGAYYYLKGTKEESFELLKSEMIKFRKERIKDKELQQVKPKSFDQELKDKFIDQNLKELKALEKLKGT